MKPFLLLALLVFPALAMAQPDAKTAVPDKIHAEAMFAGGCFWCMESEYEDLKGVSGVTSVYAGPMRETAPTYEEVSRGDSGFVEAVTVTYDPSIVTYQQLLDIFWSNVDPFDAEGQFCDKGSQYAAIIYYGSPEEERLARASLKKVEDKFGKKVSAKILPATASYPAEEYHQDYAKKNKVRYNLYKNGCGRPDRLKELSEEHKG